MTVLGIETSSAVCSVGLANDAGVYGERSLVESHIHSEKLLTLIQDLCNEKHFLLSDLGGIAISIGPGSFTGLRIGLSTAKGLCYALGIPLIAVPSFESIASAFFTVHPEYERTVICVDAKQGDYYIAIFDRTGNELLPVHIGTLSSMLTLQTDTIMMLSDRPEETRKVLAGSSKEENILAYCRGDVTACLGMMKMKSGMQSHVADCEPMYLKDFFVKTHLK